ncbi:hypothetical protein KOW79_005259 [Hemibagrus wyckioides]|uniref:Uncharacterized protein n=1 Tax=Hemibagrus wyckioides TaxID=337641 RepID=A0A9D3P1N0_9TELE|nr:hypothetical protein KOW79_005259 [Hemibagrus wyckioides]
MRDNERQGPRWQYPPTRLERPYVFAHARLNLCQGTKLALYRFQLYSARAVGTVELRPWSSPKPQRAQLECTVKGTALVGLTPFPLQTKPEHFVCSCDLEMLQNFRARKIHIFSNTSLVTWQERDDH